MGVRGRSRWDYEYKTFSDFGDPERKAEISRHYSLAAAKRAFKRLKLNYSYRGKLPDRHLWRCWQEDRMGNIINDSGSVWRPAGVA